MGGGIGSSGFIDAPLQPKSTLTLGYGDSTASPFEFLLRPGEDVDMGFMKLFVATSPADFSSLLQGSPFDLERDQTRESREFKDAPAVSADLWGTKVYTIIQKKVSPSGL